MCQDTNQFLKLLKSEYSDALKYCKALCARGNPDEAEDILQQSLLKALENFDELKDQEKFRSWFFKIITREFFNSVRGNFWKKFLPLNDSIQAPEFPEIFGRMENDDNKNILNNALSKISSKERSAILLFELEGFSIEEIKEIQNEKSSSAVKSRLSRARKKLKKLIEEKEKKFTNSISQNKIILGDIKNEAVRLFPEAGGK